jgi:hypothetical protein
MFSDALQNLPSFHRGYSNTEEAISFPFSVLTNSARTESVPKSTPMVNLVLFIVYFSLISTHFYISNENKPG